MFDYGDFATVFGSSKSSLYDGNVIKKIHDARDARAKLGIRLIIEKLLEALNIDDPSKLYPPSTNSELKDLHENVAGSESPDHYKHSVILYLLKDVSHKHGNSTTPQDFVESVYLPAKYETFIHGVWQLDRNHFERALDFLSEPALIPTFPEEILYTLCKLCKPQDHSLPIAYFNTVSPPLTSPKVLHAYFAILCQVSVTEAFYFMRTQDEGQRSDLFARLVESVEKDHRNGRTTAKSLELVTIPFNDTENSWFQNRPQGGGSGGRSVSKELLELRIGVLGSGG